MRLLAPPGMDPVDDPLAGPRMLVNGCLLGIVVWAVVLFGIFATVRVVRADHDMACGYSPDAWWPRPVWISPSLNSAPWQLGMAGWNNLGGNEFLQTFDSNAAPTWIVPSPNGRTWVWVNCSGVESVVYAGTDVDLSQWASHELGHVWDHADHIQSWVNPAGYVNPKYCNGPNASPYQGIMSYCSPRNQFSPADVTMHRGY